MKIAFLWGSDFSCILQVKAIQSKSVYILTPEDEPLFPKEAQIQLKDRLGGNCLSVSYDQKK